MKIATSIVLKSAVTSVLLATPFIKADAVIANPEPQTVTQPDGSKVTVRVYGDEYFNYTLTADGYQVVYNSDSKAWEYATLSAEGDLVSTGEAATNRPIGPQRIKGLRNRPSTGLLNDIKARRTEALKTGQYDYSKFRGLVILVEYNDAPFTREDIHTIFDDMVNKPGYDGYMTNNLIPSKVECTGSVRDYYFENSNGLFDPRFDVIGPVKINYSQHFANQSAGAQTLVKAALKAADDQIDYSVYDTDGNRQVDMVYFIFSGGGSNFSGNDATLIWPHASTVMGLSLDGVSFGRYACSTELYGAPANKVLDGIGTICHEFSHVLGLPDLYDVDYATDGQSVHPAKWSVMASGSYLNMSRTPCGYSLFERYALGFTTPRLITEPGEYTVKPLNEGDTPDGCRINSAVEDEYFLLESRVKTRWDAYLPGEGLLVHRVDSTNTAVWENNRVNAASNHNYYTLLRAKPKKSDASVVDSDGDPFPGSGNVTSLNNMTDPSMRSWATLSTPIVLDNITANEDGSITFSTIADNVPTLVEDFALMPATSKDTTDVEGRFTTWSFSKGARIESDDETTSLTTVKGSEIVSGAIDATVENVEVEIDNPTSTNAAFRLYSSVDNGVTWRPVNTVDGLANPSVKKGETAILRYNTGALEKPALKFAQYTGNATAKCIVKRIQLSVKAGSGSAGVDNIVTDDANTVTRWFNLQGQPVANPAAGGIYIKVNGTKAVKTVFTTTL